VDRKLWDREIMQAFNEVKSMLHDESPSMTKLHLDKLFDH